jgi:hypothetical protein
MVSYAILPVDFYLLTKKEMKIVAFISNSPRRVVQRYPIMFVMGPAMKTPTKAPH